MICKTSFYNSDMGSSPILKIMIIFNSVFFYKFYSQISTKILIFPASQTKFDKFFFEERLRIVSANESHTQKSQQQGLGIQVVNRVIAEKFSSFYLLFVSFH